MNFQELINAFKDNESVNFEKVLPYKKLLYAYYKEVYMCEPALIVTDVFNAVQFVAIVPFSEVTDWINDYLNQYDMDETEKIEATETILFNSMPLERLVNLLNN